MKMFNDVFVKSARAFAAGATVCVIAVIASVATGLLSPANAAPHRHESDDFDRLGELYRKAQVADLYELQAAFHEAASHGGNVDQMLSLWADDGSLAVGATVYAGKDGLRNFFSNVSGAFKHDWVSLAPAFKTQFDIRGDTAEIYFECHYADPSVTPYVLKSDISATGTAKKVHGKWLLWNIAAGAAAL